MSDTTLALKVAARTAVQITSHYHGRFNCTSGVHFDIMCNMVEEALSAVGYKTTRAAIIAAITEAVLPPRTGHSHSVD